MSERRARAGSRARLIPELLLLGAAALPSAASGEAGAPAGDAAVVLEWNEVAYEVGYAEDELRTFKTQRAMAMTHLAMHDAVNAVLGRFAPYTLEASDPDADPVAAAAHAAHGVLTA